MTQNAYIFIYIQGEPMLKAEIILILRAERPLQKQRTNEIKSLLSYNPFNDNDKNQCPL